MTSSGRRELDSAEFLTFLRYAGTQRLQTQGRQGRCRLSSLWSLLFWSSRARSHTYSEKSVDSNIWIYIVVTCTADHNPLNATSTRIKAGEFLTEQRISSPRLSGLVMIVEPLALHFRDTDSTQTNSYRSHCDLNLPMPTPASDKRHKLIFLAPKK